MRIDSIMTLIRLRDLLSSPALHLLPLHRRPCSLPLCLFYFPVLGPLIPRVCAVSIMRSSISITASLLLLTATTLAITQTPDSLTNSTPLDGSSLDDGTIKIPLQKRFSHMKRADGTLDWDLANVSPLVPPPGQYSPRQTGPSLSHDRQVHEHGALL